MKRRRLRAGRKRPVSGAEAFEIATAAAHPATAAQVAAVGAPIAVVNHVSQGDASTIFKDMVAALGESAAHIVTSCEGASQEVMGWLG